MGRYKGDVFVKKPTPNKSDEVMSNFKLPNHSGDHSAGQVLTTPVNDNDIVNKKYVDDAVDADITTHASNASAHHTKYTDTDAVSAVATADDYLKNDGDTATGDYTFDTNTLKINSSNHRVGIGTTSPSGPLHVVWEGADATILRIDGGSSSMYWNPAFLLVLPASGLRKGFQIRNGSDTYAWCSFEWSAGGTDKPGFALGPGGSSPRDTNIYRDAASVLKTNDTFKCYRLFISTIKSGATQAGAGASAGEVWKTASHASLPDNVLMIGV